MAHRDRQGVSEPERWTGDGDARVDAAPLRHRRRGIVVGLVVALVVVAVPVVATSLSGSGDDPVVRGDAKQVVVAALGTTAASGRYDMTTTLHVDTATSAGACGAASSAHQSGEDVSPPRTCVPSGIRPSVDITSHGTVNLDPYALVSTSNQSGLGVITTYFNGTTVWEIGGGNYGSTTGSPLSGFATLVEGTLGPGEGASTMISIASHGGYLALEESSVQQASPAGTGTVDGATVTYFDVTIDVAELADAPDLTDEERTTIQEALPLLRSAGYSGTTEHIGIDAAGYIRETTATEHFSDGSSETRHSILSNFGCAPTVYLPNETPPPVTTTTPCQPPATTTPASSTSSAATTTTTVTTTSVTPATTAPMPSTTTTLSPPTTTTSTGP
jgi:hypothetical protein